MNQPQAGIFHRARVTLFGERAERLRESTSHAHWLSYVLIMVQSAAVVLALGHQQLRLLLSGDPAILLIAALSVFLLVATVWAADLCLLATLQRVPVLARNRATWALIEHLIYVAFVLAVEGSTLALVLAVLDTNPRALVSDAPIIPAGGWLFAAQIIARAALTVWTAVQLWIVRGKLPPQWSTLLLEARELLGGKAQQVMAGLNLEDAPLAALFDAYAQMSRPPARAARWWNRSLIAREATALAEEDRQRDAVVRALSAFDDMAGNTDRATSSPPSTTNRPPTGPGSPTAAPAETMNEGDTNPLRNPGRATRAAVVRFTSPSTPRRRMAAAKNRGYVTGANGRRIPESVEAKARAAWLPGMGIPALQEAAGISRASAQKYAAKFSAEDASQDQELAQ